MPGNSCFLCQSDECSFFGVPQDEYMKNQWEKACGISLPPDAWICEKHFRPNDLSDTSKGKRLCADAVPTQLLCTTAGKCSNYNSSVSSALSTSIAYTNSLCRACVQEFNVDENGKATECVNILETPELVSKLYACISNEFALTNKYSHYICTNCYKIINEFYDFRKMCMESMQVFEDLQCQQELEELILDKSADTMGSTAKLSPSKNGKKDGQMETEETQQESLEITEALASELYSQGDFINIDDLELDADEDAENSDNDTQSNIHINSTNSNSVSSKILGDVPSTTLNSSVSESKSPTTYHCDICPANFDSEIKFNAHKREHRALRPYTCPRDGCLQAFERKRALTWHLREHAGKEHGYACDQESCDKVYQKKSALNTHKWEYHKLGSEPKTYVCEKCGKVFECSTTLNGHQYTHKDMSERPFVCDQPDCELRFKTNDKLRVHLMRHAGIRNYECSYCGQRKTTRSELKVHMNFHTLERTWPCRFCDHVCNSAGNLKAHIRNIHEQARDYACSYCDKKFAKPDTRKYHEMIHTGEKPHVCGECGKSFRQPSALRTHSKVHQRQRKQIEDDITDIKETIEMQRDEL